MSRRIVRMGFRSMGVFAIGRKQMQRFGEAFVHLLAGWYYICASIRVSMLFGRMVGVGVDGRHHINKIVCRCVSVTSAFSLVMWCWCAI